MGLGRWLRNWFGTGPNPHLSQVAPPGSSGYWYRDMPLDAELRAKHFPEEAGSAALPASSQTCFHRTPDCVGCWTNMGHCGNTFNGCYVR